MGWELAVRLMPELNPPIVVFLSCLFFLFFFLLQDCHVTINRYNKSVPNSRSNVVLVNQPSFVVARTTAASCIASSPTTTLI